MSPEWTLDLIGRGDWIRTSDPLRPRQVRYQAALRPDVVVGRVSHYPTRLSSLVGGDASDPRDGSAGARSIDDQPHHRVVREKVAVDTNISACQQSCTRAELGTTLFRSTDEQ